MDTRHLAMSSLRPGVEESGNVDVAPSSANKDDGEPNATAGTNEFHHQHPSSASFLPIVTPTDDTKEMIQEHPTTIEPPTLSISDHSDVAPPTSLTKQALRPPPASIFPPPSAAATAASSYHHPHTDGRKNLGVAIKASANMYGSLSPNAVTRTAPSILDPPKMTGIEQAAVVSSASFSSSSSGPVFQTSARLNKFVKRLHDMLQAERGAGTVEWRKGLLVLHSTSDFAENTLPKYFKTKNFKTFRRQLNYYGFTHVRSFSATGSHTTALWLNQELADSPDSDSISSVLRIKRIDPTEPTGRTAENRRVRKEEATIIVQDIGLDTKALQREQLRSLALRAPDQCTAPQSPLTQEKAYTMTVHRHAPAVSVTDYSSPSQPSDDDHSASRFVGAATETVSHTADDAANLLLMLSRATS